MQSGLSERPREVEARLRSVLSGLDVVYVSALDVLCDGRGCLTTRDGQPTTWDARHLTEAGSLVLAGVILRRLPIH